MEEEEAAGGGGGGEEREAVNGALPWTAAVRGSGEQSIGGREEEREGRGVAVSIMKVESQLGSVPKDWLHSY